MIRKLLGSVGVGFVIGLVGCTHNSGSWNPPEPTTTMSSDGLTRDQLQAKSEDEMKQGNDLLAKGMADNDAEEKLKGQQLLDDAQRLQDEARNVGPVK